MEEQDQRLRQSQRAYVGFLDDGEQDGQYESLVKEMIANRGKRLVVNINDLRKALPDRAKALLENAGDEIVALQVQYSVSFWMMCFTLIMSPIYCKKDSFLKIFQFLTSNFYSD
jgi:hypothetical protein